MKTKDLFVHPEDTSNMVYWTRKWGITYGQLKDAILHTGSVHSDHLKKYLKKDSWYFMPFSGLFRFFRK